MLLECFQIWRVDSGTLCWYTQWFSANWMRNSGFYELWKTSIKMAMGKMTEQFLIFKNWNKIVNTVLMFLNLEGR